MDAKPLAEELKKAIDRFDRLTGEMLELLNQADANGSRMAKAREISLAEEEISRLSKALREQLRQSRNDGNNHACSAAALRLNPCAAPVRRGKTPGKP
jgi:hypothetical protein